MYITASTAFVIDGYLNGLSRPEQVVHLVREVLGTPVVSKGVLSQRTNNYQRWVESCTRDHKIPMEWVGKGVRKEDYVLPAPHRLEKRKAYGVYFIFQKHGAGPNLSHRRTEVSNAGPESPHSGAPDEPLAHY